MGRRWHDQWQVAVSCILALLLVASCGEAPPPIPKGTIDEALAIDGAFYSIRGGYDYDRLPLRIPFQLVDVAHEPLLCKGKDIVLHNIEALNVVSNTIFGTFGRVESFGKWREGGFFVINISDKAPRTFSAEGEFKNQLATLGITNLSLRPVKPLIKDFMFEGKLAFGR